MTASTAPAVAEPLNPVQVMLLRLFSRPISAHDLNAIRELLLDYYENALQQEVEHIVKKKGIERHDFEKKLKQQQRTKK